MADENGDGDQKIYDLQIPEPEEIENWLEEVTGGTPAEFTSDRVIDMLVRSYNHKKRTWEKAQEYLKEKKLLSAVKDEVVRSAREELKQTISKRRRRKVLESGDELREESDRPGAFTNFDITKMVRYGDRDSVWSIQINGKEWIEKITTDVLISPQKFKRMFIDKMGFVPKLPNKQWKWENYCDQKMTDPSVMQFERTETESYVKDEVIYILDNLAEGSDVAELDSRKCIALPSGKLGVKFSTVRSKLIHRVGHNISNQELGSILSDLGVRSERVSLQGSRPRVYVFSKPVRDPGAEIGASEVIPIFGDTSAAGAPDPEGDGDE